MSAISITGNSIPAVASTRRGRRGALWLLRRIVAGILVLWATATITFWLQAITSGNRARAIVDQAAGSTENPPAKALNSLNAKYGFSHSLFHQYIEYIGNVAHGNLGVSYFQHVGVTKIIGEQIMPTILLTVCALALAWIIALAITIAATGRGRLLSRFASGVQIVMASLPSYWVGTILLVVFAVKLGFFPVTGGTSFAGFILPLVTLALPVAGFIGQVTQDEFANTLEQPFVMSARTRGMSDLGVRLRHVLRHSILPALTLSGWALGYLFSGAVFVETVFARPGIGHVLVTGANEGDIPLVSGIVIVSAAVYVVANILVDVLYSIVDPRLRGA